MRGITRESFVNVLQAHNPRPLPREFIDRNYDYFDRATRCAVLKLYRAMPDLNQLGREHADALRPYDKPALVIWGDRDPFLPQHIARSQREGFPSADIHIFANSGHWPYVDEREQTRALMGAFLRRHVPEQAGSRILVMVTPRVVRRGRRTRIKVRVATDERSGAAGCRRPDQRRWAHRDDRRERPRDPASAAATHQAAAGRRTQAAARGRVRLGPRRQMRL